MFFFSLHQTACLLPPPPPRRRRNPMTLPLTGPLSRPRGERTSITIPRRRSVSHGDERRRKCRFQCRGLFLRREAAITLTRSCRGFCALNPTGPLCVCVARGAEPRSPFPPGRLVEACQAAPPAFEKLSALPATNTSPPHVYLHFMRRADIFLNMVHELLVGKFGVGKRRQRVSELTDSQSAADHSSSAF